MTKIKVKVKEGVFPVRYDGERFSVGEELTIEDKHFNELIFEKVEESKKTTRTTKTSESE
ncbi:MAG: hypothetical protein GX072_07985 [Lysinibacillus sp.]|nr:hypothetical protein [Lysinibacillus sp.]